MSYDFNTNLATCDHRITLERYIVNPLDWVTLNYASDTTVNIRGPINGKDSVELFIGGKLVQVNDPTYGYTLEKDGISTITNELFWKVVFNTPVRIFNQLIELNYITRSQYCLKCSGLKVLNDFMVSNTRSFSHIVGNDKLVLKTLKWVLTSKGMFYPNFICQLKNYIGKKFGSIITEADISNEIFTTLSKLKKVQIAQSQVQTLTQSEILGEVSSVDVKRDISNPLLLQVSLVITSIADPMPLPLNFTLKTS